MDRNVDVPAATTSVAARFTEWWQPSAPAARTGGAGRQVAAGELTTRPAAQRAAEPAAADDNVSTLAAMIKPSATAQAAINAHRGDWP